jgi:hypothetical protein
MTARTMTSAPRAPLLTAPPAPAAPLAALTLPDRALWSVGGHAPGAGGREIVVLVPPWADPAEGLERARVLLSADPVVAVRVVARGATVRRDWPSWVEAALGRLALTELDAYSPCDKTPVAQEVLREGAAWVERLFDGVLPGLPASRALFPTVCNRILQPLIDAWPLARGLAHHHGTDEILCTQPDWPGLEPLAALVTASGGRVRLPEEPWRVPWRVRLCAWVLAGAAAALFRRVREFWQERPSRSHLRALRARLAPLPPPRVWLGVIGDWPWSSRHVLDGLLPALRERDDRVGILLQGTLQPGLRPGSAADVRTAGPIFPSLDHPLLAGRLAAVDQCVSVEDAARLGRSLAASTLEVLRVLGRLLAQGPRLRFGPAGISLDRRLPDLAKLATIDVYRAREALEATGALLARRSLSGATVIWSHASQANFAVPDVAVQQEGATTIDLVHGGLADYVDHLGKDRTACTVKALWTVAEARGLAPYLPGQRCVGSFVPRRPPAPQIVRPAHDPVRLLCLTNYVNGYTLGYGRGRLSLECWQVAFFQALEEAIAALSVPCEVRWRPHPADVRSAVQANLERLPWVRLADGTLHENLAWADVVLTSVSSIIVEALAFPRPLFVQYAPLWDFDVAAGPFDPERRFQNGSELGPRLSRCIQALRAGDAAAFAPEALLRERLFGAARSPRPLADLLDVAAVLEGDGTTA